MAHHIAGAQHLANGNRLVCVRTEHVKYASRYASAHGQFGCGQRRQRCELCGFDDDRAACRQSRRDLAGDHGQRKVPRRNGCANAYRLTHHQQTAVVVECGQGFAVDAFGLFGKPLHKAGAVGNFACGLGQRLALFGCHDSRQVGLVGHQQVKPFAQNLAAHFGCCFAPCTPSCIGCGNGLFGMRRAQVGHVGQVLACGRVGHGKGAVAIYPFSVDQGFGF